MSLKPLAPTFLLHFQSSPDPLISLGNSTTMSLPLAHLFCGMPPQINPSYAPSINQYITDGTFLQPTNQSEPDATVYQPTPGPSALLSSPLQHQANYLQANHKTIQQFHQHLKSEHLDRQTLQLIVLQLQNDFALLRYLLLSDKDIAAKHPATSRPINPNPQPTSSVFPLPCTDDPKLRRSTPVGPVGPPRVKTNNPANADIQPTPNTQEAPPILAQNLTARISKLAKNICRRNSNLYIYHYGDSFSKLFPI